MTPEERLEHVKKHYALNVARDYAAAERLLTDDFFVTVPPPMPFAGTYRGKGAMRELIQIVTAAAEVIEMKVGGMTVGDDCAVVLVEFNLAGSGGQPFHVAELLRFRENQICEVRPYYFDPAPMLAAAKARAGKA